MVRMNNHIICCINDAYAQHCGVLLASLFENNKDLAFHIHVFSFSLGVESKKNLTHLVHSYGQEITVRVIEKPEIELPNLANHYISADTYMRLFVPPYMGG